MNATEVISNGWFCGVFVLRGDLVESFYELGPGRCGSGSCDNNDRLFERDWTVRADGEPFYQDCTGHAVTYSDTEPDTVRSGSGRAGRQYLSRFVHTFEWREWHIFPSRRKRDKQREWLRGT